MTLNSPAPPPGFDPEADFDDVSPETYTRVPRSSHRRGEHELRTLLALGVLTLYLSNKKGWKPPSATELAAKYGEGAKRIRDAITEVERAGFLVRYRTQGAGGLWKTHVRVSSDPDALNAIREWAAQLKAHQDAAAAARKAAGIRGGGRRAAEAAASVTSDAATEVGPDGTSCNPVPPAETEFSQVGPDVRDRHSVHRDSADRHSVQGHLSSQESNPGTQKESREVRAEDQKPPVATPAPPSPSPVAELKTGGDSTGDNPLKTAALEAERIRDGASGWGWQKCLGAGERAVANGHGVALVAATLVEIAHDRTGTSFPGRLSIVLAEKARATTTGVTSSGGSGSIPAGRARCKQHPTEVAGACSPCAGELRGQRDDVDEALAQPVDTGGLSGAALARAELARRGLPGQQQSGIRRARVPA